MTSWLVEGGVVLTFATAVIGFAQTRRHLVQIKVLVDGRMDVLLARVTQLTDTLDKAGVAVPAVPDPPGPGEAGERLAP